MKRYDYECAAAGVCEVERGEYVLHSEACPQWTRQLPTQPGLYWTRWRNPRAWEEQPNRKGILCIVESAGILLYGENGYGMMFELKHFDIDGINGFYREFCGPLYEPAD